MARPLKELDEQQIFKLAKIHCTNEEIAQIVGCDPDTLTNRFSELIKKGQQFGKCSLRRAQFKLAYNGNVSMLIWLGKQHLGQSEKIETISREYINQEIEIIGKSEVNEDNENRVKSFLK